MEYSDLNPFTKGFVEALFFTDCHCDNPELENKTFEDLAPKTLAKIIEICAGFEMLHKALLEKAGTPEQNGHDFWLTINGHGAGFWDRGYGETGEALTQACKNYSPIYVYAGDDGLIYLD